MNIDLDASFFSRTESHWSVFTEDAGSPAGGTSPQLSSLTLRYVCAGSTDVYELSLLAGRESVPFHYVATPSLLTLIPADAAAAGAGADGKNLRCVEIILPERDQMRIRTRRVGCRLEVAPASRGNWEALLPRGGTALPSWRAVVSAVKLDIDVLCGSAHSSAHWRPKPAGDRRHQYSDGYVLAVDPDSELLITDYESEPPARPPVRPFDHEEKRVAAEFAAFDAAGPPVEERYRETASGAAYLCWASIVAAQGNFAQPSMLMSKRRMTNTWNWDNYFNAWGLSLRDPELAWRIYQLHFTHQNPDGALADGINEQKIGWIYTKPPVHGLVLARLIETGVVTESRLAEIYPKLVRATRWWFRYRDDDGDLICQYHHGNDSGWDDATLFDLEPPVESPDLSALLVVQLRVLADVAHRLGLHGEAEEHTALAEQVLAALVEHSVRDARFVALKDTTHEQAPTSSLLLRVPMVLGALLPPEIADALASDLADPSRFLGPHGLATEAMDSDLFLPDGYWRGPGWAPALMLIVYGLVDAGRVELAREIARRFCDTCVRSGFAECFNVQTGAPLHDRGYTWTASVFTILAAWLNEQDSPEVS